MAIRSFVELIFKFLNLSFCIHFAYYYVDK